MNFVNCSLGTSNIKNKIDGSYPKEIYVPPFSLQQKYFRRRRQKHLNIQSRSKRNLLQ